jgi:lysophospholipase
MRGNRCTKISASQYDAFASPNFPPLATVTSAGIDVQWHSIRRPKVLAKFCVQPTLDSTNVACLRIFPGITPSLVDSVLRVPGLRGLILETFGSGTAPSGLPMLSTARTPSPLPHLGTLTDVLKSAITRGLVIVSVSQCASGTVSPLYVPATRLGAAGVVFGHDMTTEAALTKLFFLLAMRDINPADVVAQMAVSLRGEMTAVPAAPQFAPRELREPALSAPQAAFAALGYAVAEGDAATVALMVDAEPELLVARDYVGNSALHLAAVGREQAVVRVLLQRGASVHVRNAAGSTPLGNAERAGRRANVELLARAGGVLNVEELGEGA